MFDTVLVDGSNIARANDKGNKLSVGSFYTQAIYGTIRSLKVLARDYFGWNVIVLWDGRAQWRYDLYEEYKGNRAPKNPQEEAEDAAYKAQVPFIRKSLQFLGLRQFLVTDQEADDMAGFLGKRISANGGKVVYLSGDQDWIQLLDENSRWVDPINDRRIVFKDFIDQTGYFTPRAFLEGKAMIGDNSDNIKGVDKIGAKTAPEILAQFGSVDEFYRQVDSGLFVPKYVKHKNLASPAGREIFARNMKLMNLIDAKRPDPGQVVDLKPNFSPEHFRIICEKLGFRSILRDFDNFVTSFRRDSLGA